MELNEKLQKLRKEKGLTQEELAAALYVSRTAISKWESGRGYPSIDSLKTIANYFSITIDELLSGEELLNVTQSDAKQAAAQFGKRIFGLLDISAVMLFFLPLFGQKADNEVYAVSLASLDGISTYLKIIYFALIILTIASGIF